MANKTKICKYCRTEIDSKATICPNCQKKQSSPVGCLTVVGIFVLIGIIGTAGSNGNSNRSSENTASITSVDNSASDNTKKEIADANSEEDAVPTIEEQVMWETDGVKITATDLKKTTLWGAALNVLIENNSDKDIGIGVRELIVNDFMITDLSSFTVTAGNKQNNSIDLLRSQLKAAGIENIGKIEVYMYIYDKDTYETLAESGCITVTTSDIDKMDTVTDISGTTLFEQDGIKIVGTYVDEDSFWGKAIVFYIENNSDKNVIVTDEEMAVNGFMVNSYFSETVYAGKKSVSTATLLRSQLEENGIESIETVQDTFKILDEDYNEIANSGKVNFTVNNEG